jgi:hypothetical protein
VSRVWLGAALVQVMSAEDDVAHLISFPLHEAGLLVGEGRYIASCGKTVLAAAMSTAPGRQCSCVELP